MTSLQAKYYLFLSLYPSIPSLAFKFVMVKFSRERDLWAGRGPFFKWIDLKFKILNHLSLPSSGATLNQ